MKKRKAKVIADIPETRMLRLWDEAGRGIESGTTAEWRAVAMYFQQGYARVFWEAENARMKHLELALTL